MHETGDLLLLIAAIAVAPVLLIVRRCTTSCRATRAPITGRCLRPDRSLRSPARSSTARRLRRADLRGRWIDAVRRIGRLRSALRRRPLRVAAGADDPERRTRARPARMADSRRSNTPRRACSPSTPISLRPASHRRPEAGWPEGADRIYLIDPLGNFVLAWPSNPDIKAMARDLSAAAARFAHRMIRRAAATAAAPGEWMRSCKMIAVFDVPVPA